MIGSDANSPTSSDLNSPQSSQILRSYLKLVFVTQTIGLTSIVLILIWICKHLGGLDWSQPPYEFNWHPLLMVIGMIYLYGNAILTYRLFPSQAKYKLKLIHASINSIVLILSWIALYSVIDFHNKKYIPNFYSLHSWIGLITIILFNTQFIFGFITFLYPGLSGSYRQMLLSYHVFAGLAIFICSAGSWF